MCVLSIKVPIRKKSGNLSYAPRMNIYIYIYNQVDESTEFLDALLPSIPIICRSRQVFWAASCINTDLMEVILASRPTLVCPCVGVHRKPHLLVRPYHHHHHHQYQGVQTARIPLLLHCHLSLSTIKLGNPLDDTQYLRRRDECNFLMFGQHWSVHVNKSKGNYRKWVCL